MLPVFFDATRIFVRGSRFSPTGIDRAVLAYARWLLHRPDVKLQPVVTMGGVLWRVPRSLLQQTIVRTEAFQAARRGGSAAESSRMTLESALESGSRAPHAPIRSKSIIQQVPSRARWHASILGRGIWHLRPIKPEAGALYLNVSHTGLGDPHVLPRLAARRVRCIVMVHDLIPIDYPEYCAPSARLRHVRRMDSILGHAELVIANSQSTADAIASYAANTGRHCPPVRVALLGIEPEFLSPLKPMNVTKPYFVSVGTLEARKNLTFLLALWRRLSEALGAAAPSLVLVGRRGWENESVLDHLERSEAAAKLVHEVSDLDDAELASLVAGAHALLAPSFAEGFDLPVIEALSLRTPVIASDIPVHRELAGAAATLIDPLDGPGWFNAITSAKGARGPAYSAPQWPDHFAALEDVLTGSR